MSRMVRKQIRIEPRQEKLLKQWAKELEISESELVRRAIDRFGLDPAVPSSEQRLRAWEEERAFMEERKKIVAPQTGRSWTRDEIYDERLERYSR